MSKEKILVIGANGQIGSVLTEALRKAFGVDNVVATDIRAFNGQDGLFELLNVMDAKAIASAVDRHGITQIYHLAAILSAKGEQNPLQTWDINMGGLFNVFEVARDKKISKVFYPSSIAVFGADIPRQMTPNDAVLKPTTVYGMSKASGELWSQYYHLKYGLDIRSVRYPGVIGWQSDPGGGTTDYAVDIYHYAVKGQDYSCFLSEATALPMIYMEDAIRATLELMEADSGKIKITSFASSNEYKLLTDFNELLRSEYFNGNVIFCAHNGKEFDFPYLARRMIINQIELPNALKLFGKKPWEIPHLDTLELWKFGDYKHFTSLDLLAHILGIESPKNDIDGSQVAHVYYKEKDLERIKKYCEKDVETLIKVFLKIQSYS